MDNKEMSLDEVLSSIKKMMIDKEPPVLDLTNMVTENGEIVDVQNVHQQETSMGSFLKFVSEDDKMKDGNNTMQKENNIDIREVENMAHEKVTPVIREALPEESSPIIATENSIDNSMDKAMLVIIENLMKPMIEKWLKENLAPLVGKTVEEEVKKIFSQKK